MGKKVLLTGATGSGKSARALEIALSEKNFEQRCFIATARPLDSEMKERIRIHKEERGNLFKTIEEPLHLAKTISNLGGYCVVVDCLTLWVSNLLAELESDEASDEIKGFVDGAETFNGTLIIVTNETGMGIIPSGLETRRYQANLSALNRQAVSVCDEAYLMVSGAAVRIK